GSTTGSMANRGCGHSAQIFRGDRIAMTSEIIPKEVTDLLHRQFGDDIFRSWFSQCSGEIDGVVARLYAPTKFIKSYIEIHYAEQLNICWKTIFPQVQRVEIKLRAATDSAVSTARETAPISQKMRRDPKAPSTGPNLFGSRREWSTAICWHEGVPPSVVRV